MEIQLGTCRRLRSRISERQCEINRNGRVAVPGKSPAIAPCFACDGCPGLEDINGELCNQGNHTGLPLQPAKRRGRARIVKTSEVSKTSEVCLEHPLDIAEPMPESPKRKKTKTVKWPFTPHMNAVIRETYRTETANGTINKLAATFGYPRWAVSKQARNIGAYEMRIKEPVWCAEELQILETNAHKTVERIQKDLKKAGFRRSVAGIILKRKRLRMLGNLKGQSAHSLAECFGIDAKSITRWIEKGFLKAEKRGTHRTAAQGGDMWFIRNKDLRPFIIENIGIIDIRKVDKFWLVDVLAPGKEAA